MTKTASPGPAARLPSPRRSLLFMPGDSQRKIEKSLTLDVDSVIMDLEDGVALSRKAEARATVANALATLDFGRRERLVRVNELVTGLVEEELVATVGARPDGYLVPKVEDADDLRAVDRMVAQHEAAHGWPEHSIRLLAMIETALGVMNLREISRATPRLDALVFGAEDMAASTGAVRTRESWEVFYARSAVVTAAGAYGLQAIDCVFVDFTNNAGLEADCLFGRGLGYIGKTLIHPNQVPVANRVFAPSPQEVTAAQRLVAAFEEQQAAGAGAFALEGKMVDMPILRTAERLLARARAAGVAS
jgi:citrate lyase beta subunit